ncbi:hypothetical protein, partial [Geobacillus vulcani]
KKKKKKRVFITNGKIVIYSQKLEGTNTLPSALTLRVGEFLEIPAPRQAASQAAPVRPTVRLPCDGNKRSPSFNIIPSGVMIRVMVRPALRAPPLSDMQRLRVVMPALAI